MAPTLRTLPKSAPRLNGGPFARAWLAAGAAGKPSQGDQRLDRAITIERWDTAEGRPGGIVFAGVSSDLVVVAGVPFVNGPVGPQGLFDVTIEGEPTERWPIDDTSLGAATMRTVHREALAVEKKGGQLHCTLTAESHQPEGTLDDLGAIPYVKVAVDGLTEGTLVRRARHTPVDWRTVMPGNAQAFTPASPLMRESASVFARLGRIAPHLPVTELAWEFYELPDGHTIRFVHIMDENGWIDIAASVALNPSAEPFIFRGASLDESGVPDEPLDLDGGDGEDPDA